MNTGTVHLEALCLFVIFIKLERFCAKCTMLAGNRRASRFRREARREQQSGVGFNQPDVVTKDVLGVCLAGGHRRRDGGLVRRVVEGGDGAAVAVAHGQHAVPRAAVAAIAEHLDLVAGVDDDGAGERLHVGPPAVLEHLEAADLVVLEQQDDAAGVRVRAQARDEVRPRTRRVVADLGAEEGLVPPVAGEGALDGALLQAEVLVHGLHDALGELPELGAVLAHRLLERRRVGRPLVAVVDVEDVLPVHVVHRRHRLAALLRLHERLQRAHRLRHPESGLPEAVALGAHLLDALKKLQRDAMVHQLRPITKIPSDLT